MTRTSYQIRHDLWREQIFAGFWHLVAASMLLLGLGTAVWFVWLLATHN